MFGGPVLLLHVSVCVQTSSTEEANGEAGAGRILFMVTTFDRGQSTRDFNGRDKLDYMLMMMDEMREACEVGRGFFAPPPSAPPLFLLKEGFVLTVDHQTRIDFILMTMDEMREADSAN